MKTPIGDKQFQDMPRRVAKFRENRPRDDEKSVDGKNKKYIMSTFATQGGHNNTTKIEQSNSLSLSRSRAIAVRSVTYRTDRKKVWHKIERPYKTEVAAINSKPFTRNQRASSLSEQNKSALTDHISQDNHVIYWPAATILDRESDKSTRWIKEAVHIRNEGRRCLNRDEGSYTLSHTYDRFLATSQLYRG